MPLIEIRHRTGRVEGRKLTRQVPLLVGRLASNDIVIDAADVAPVHCRISWNRRSIEVAAVTSAGVQCNGSTVRHAVLSPGDVVRVGDVDLLLVDDGASPVAAPAEAQEQAVPAPETPRQHQPGASLELKSVTEDNLPLPPQYVTSRPAPRADRLADGSEGAKSVDEQASPASRPPHWLDDEPDIDVIARPELAMPASLAADSRNKPGLLSAAANLRHALGGAPKRPGEQDALRSPLVVGLGIGLGLLLLTAVTIWFVLEREQTQRAYDAAQTALDQGLYAQAIEGFESFLKERPRHRLADAARLAIARSRVQQPLAGSVPDWKAALAALNDFIDEYRDTEEFADPQSEYRKFVLQSADRIALGGAEAARNTRQRSPLAESAEATRLFDLYSPVDAKPTERLREIAAATRAAEAAVAEQEAFDAVAQRLDEAMAAGTPFDALPDYRRLLDRHSSAASNKPLQDRLRKVLALVKSLVAADDKERLAIAGGRNESPALPRLALTRRVRVRSDVASVGATVFAVAEGTAFGVDSATGEPLWRYVVGDGAPFTPLPVSALAPGLLVFDALHNELVLLHQRSGQTVWRLPLDGAPTARPVVHEGQVYVTTDSGGLEQIDLQTGHSANRLKFAQPLSGPPVVAASGQRLYTVGHSDVLYVLSRRPLACEQAAWLGQGPGAVVAPPQMLRAYLLLAENDRTSQSRLRLLDTTVEDRPPVAIADAVVEGLVRDLVAVRGKQLAVPSSSERVSAFTVAETGDRQALAFVATYQVSEPQGGPIFVSIGQDDQLWMVSTALRRFTISRDSLLPDKQQAAIGLAAQPLQMLGDSLFVARRTPYSRAVIFSEVERYRLATQWQTTLGSAMLAAMPSGRDGSVVGVNTLGEFFQVSPQELANGGFKSQAVGQIAVPEGLHESLAANSLADGRLAIRCGGPTPRLWLAGGDGQSREFRLSNELQADPISLGGGVLLPLAGRLRLVARSPDNPAVVDLPAPVTESATPAWRGVSALDATRALALNSQGRLTRVELRTEPVAHLAEIASWEAGHPVDVGLAVAGARVVVGDSAGRLTLLDAGSFEPQGDQHLEQPPRQTPWIVGDVVLVETLDGHLVGCDMTRRLARLWANALGKASLVGAPLEVNERLLVALVDGRVLLVDRATGKIVKSHALEERLAFGPQRWGEHFVVGTADGCLIRLNSLWSDVP